MTETKFTNAADYEKFSDAYQEYLRRGYSPEASYEKASALLEQASEMDGITRKLYGSYVRRNGLEPDEALALAKVKAKELKDKPEEKSAERKSENVPSLNVTKWYDDFFGNALKPFTKRVSPFSWFFDDAFGNDLYRRLFEWETPFGSCGCGNDSCKCGSSKKEEGKDEKKETKKDIAQSKPISKAVEKEVQKVLDSLPKGEVSDENTKVKITKSDPNDYEFSVEHTSPNGSSFSSYTKRCVKPR